MVKINGNESDMPYLDLARALGDSLVICAGEIDNENDELGCCPNLFTLTTTIEEYISKKYPKTKDNGSLSWSLKHFGWFPGTYPSAIGDPYTYSLCPLHFQASAKEMGKSTDIEPSTQSLSWF